MSGHPNAPVAWLPKRRWEQMTAAEPWLTNIVYSEDQGKFFECVPLYSAPVDLIEERDRLREENERLRERGQAFANYVRRGLYRLHGQEFASTVSELSAFDAILSPLTAEGREP
jgi:hypothetical protein